MSASKLKRLSFRVVLWMRARILPLQVRGRSFEDVLKLAPPETKTDFSGLPVDYMARRVLRTTRHPWLMRDRRCLRQGLLGFRFLAEAGHEPELHFGVDPKSMSEERLSAHCWVCLDGKPVLNDRLPDMVTIFIHPAPRRLPERAA